MENLVKTLRSNPDLLEQVVKLWTDGASNEKIAEAFAAKGVPVEQEQIEQLLALLQKERSQTIENGVLDKDLMKVVGGGDDGTCEGSYHLGACQTRWYAEACAATVETYSWCKSNDHCIFWSSTYTRYCANDARWSDETYY